MEPLSKIFKDGDTLPALDLNGIVDKLNDAIADINTATAQLANAANRDEVSAAVNPLEQSMALALSQISALNNVLRLKANTTDVNSRLNAQDSQINTLTREFNDLSWDTPRQAARVLAYGTDMSSVTTADVGINIDIADFNPRNVRYSTTGKYYVYAQTDNGTTTFYRSFIVGDDDGNTYESDSVYNSPNTVCIGLTGIRYGGNKIL